MEEISVFSIIPIHDEISSSNVAFDVFFFNRDTKLLGQIRIVNVYLSFLVMRLPGLTIDQTLEYISSITSEVKDQDFVLKIRKDLRDSSFCNAETSKYEFVEVFSRSPSRIQSLLGLLSTSLKSEYYPHIFDNPISKWDESMMDMTETPFRFTRNVSNFANTKYYLSTKYGIPFIGSIDIDRKVLDGEIQSNYLKTDERVSINHRWNLIANSGDDVENENIRKCFHQHIGREGNEIDNMTIASYDIETYNPGKRPDPTDKSQTIFNIGVGIFRLLDEKPIYKCSIIMRDLDRIDCEKLSDGHYLVKNEYGCNDERDITEYICVKSEREVLLEYIKILEKYKPHLILSFNGFTFDDIAIWYRVKDDQELCIRYLQLFVPYNILELSKLDKSLIPQFKKIDLKLEGKTKTKDRCTVRSQFTQTIDVMFILKQGDPKRFSAMYKLNYMLMTYGVKNPFNKDMDLTKTGLSIDDMFRYWDEGSHTYEIAHYCCQDAWITGTLLITRNTIIDKMSMAKSTSTSLEDAIYRAVSLNVQMTLNAGGYKYKFAVQDLPGNGRVGNKTGQLGLKEFANQTIVGGAVRCVMPGRNFAIVAQDANSLYPSVIRALNIDNSCKIDPRVIKHPSEYGLREVSRVQLNDAYGGLHYRYRFIIEDE